MSQDTNSRINGLLLAHQLLVEQLAREGSLDRKRYVSDLKLAYNSLTGHHAESDGAKLLHTMVRQFEHGPKKKKKKT